MWVCGACGKTAKDIQGREGAHSYGWDVSCMLNAVLCKKPTGTAIGDIVKTADPIEN